VRKAFLAVVVLGCLVVPVRAAAIGPATTLTATGTVLTVQTQYVSVDNGDGTTTECEVLGGELRTATGEQIPFAAGGILTPAAGTPHGTLDPAVQATLDTLQTGSREGTNAIVTIVYDTTHPLCGYNLSTFVTSASLRPAPTPTPFPTATPAPTPTPTPQTTATVTGTVVRMSPLGVFVLLGTEACHVWPGRLRTASGRTIDFAVETPLAGDVRHGGANPTDPAAAPRAARLTQA
jgi:hypothetical protein